MFKFLPVVLFPVVLFAGTNATDRIVYTERVSSVPQLRGTMSPGGLRWVRRGQTLADAREIRAPAGLRVGWARFCLSMMKCCHFTNVVSSDCCDCVDVLFGAACGG